MNSNSNQPSGSLQNAVQNAQTQGAQYAQSQPPSINNNAGQGQSAYGLQNGVTQHMENASRQLNGVQIQSGEQAARAAGQQFMQTGNADLQSSVLQDTVNSGRQSVQNPQGPPQGMQ